MRTRQRIGRLTPLALALAGGLWLVATVDTLPINHQLNDALIVLSGMFRVHHGQQPGADYVTVLGQLSQILPGVFYGWTGRALSAYLLANLTFCLLALLVLYRAAVRGVPMVLHWAAAIPIVLLTLTPAAIFRAGDISMSYNRWALGLFCAATVWLFSLLHQDSRRDLLDGYVLGAVFSVLVLTKITFAPVLLLLASLLVLYRALHPRQLGAALALTCVTLAFVELWTGGFISYLQTLYAMTGTRDVLRWPFLMRLVDTSSTEVLLFLIPVIVLPLALPGKDWGLRRRVLITTFVCLVSSFFLASQNAAQHKLVVPLFIAIGVASVLMRERVVTPRAVVPGLLVAVVAIGPLYVFLTDLLEDSFQAAIWNEPRQYRRNLAELHPALEGFVVSERVDVPLDPEEMRALGNASLRDVETYRATLVALGRNRPQSLSVTEEFEMVSALKPTIERHCEVGDRIAAIAYVDPTPLFAEDRYRLGRSSIVAAWGTSISASWHPEDDWLFSRTDCILLPKVFFNHYDYSLIDFYRPKVTQSYELSGDTLFWQAFRKRSS